MIFSEGRHSKRGLSQPHTVLGDNKNSHSQRTAFEKQMPFRCRVLYPAGGFLRGEKPLKHLPHQNYNNRSRIVWGGEQPLKLRPHQKYLQNAYCVGSSGFFCGEYHQMTFEGFVGAGEDV